MFLSRISINRPIMVTMAILVFVVFGLLAYFDMPLNLMPDVKLPYITVQAIYPGAGPREIETQITEKIEDAIATVSLVDYVQSYSMDNVSIVFIAFKLGKNVDIASQEVKDQVDAIAREFPSEVEKPVVQKVDITAFPFMDIVLSGKMDGRALYDLAENNIKDRFGQVEGVAQVSLTGGNKRQISVKLKDSVVYENNISMATLMQILAAQNMDMPSGSFKKGTQEYSVRLKGQFDSVDAIGNIDVPAAQGMKKLRDVAVIEDGIEEVRSRAVYFNASEKQLDKNIVRLSITKASDGNVVKIAQEIRDILPNIQKELPKGTSLRIIRDESGFIKDTVNSTLNNIWMGILLTGLVLLLFLHDLRSTIIVALSMPISIISTFVFLQIAGFSFNMMTLTGLSTSVGVLVTNSVVVIENIFRHRDMGNSRREAADKGAAEIAVAVLASTMTNIVVFLPIASMQSMVGMFFREFALTVTFATIVSLITAFTLTPMLAALIIPKKQQATKFGDVFDRFFDKFSGVYKRFLSGVVRSKRHSVVIIVVVTLLLIASFMLVPVVGLELFPNMDQGNLTVSLELPQGYNLEQTSKVYDSLNQRLAKYKEIEHVVANLGSSGFIDSGTNIASLDVKLVDAKKRTKSSQDMTDLLTKELSDIPNVRIKVSAQASFGGGSAPIEFFLQGLDNDQLEIVKKDLTKQIKDTPGLINLDTSTRTGRAELTITPIRENMAAVGATVYDLAIALRSSVEGIVSTKYQEGGNKYDIKLSLDDEAVDNPEKIRNLTVIIFGQPYLLTQLADVTFAPGPNKITHRDRAKSVVFTADVAKGASMGKVISQIKGKMETFKFPAGYRVIWGGDAQMLEETVADMARTFMLAVLLTYMLLAAILESFSQPLIIMATVPLALIGVILALFLSGITFNILSMMAMIMLVGIVVNNAILLLDYVNQRRKDGLNTHDALLEAGEAKLKPIVMSTLSIIIGMLPMAIGVGSTGKEIGQSMGMVSIGGLIVSSFLTLIIIPAFYYLTIKQSPVERDAD